ncbi:MAG: aldo/keto reductase, partial [Acidobacteriota bacterium]
MRDTNRLTRRAFLASAGAAAASSVLGSGRAAALPDSPPGHPGPILTRAIPSSGETLPLVGLGSWITFNVGDDAAGRDSCAEVMRAFFREGGR